jgi:hypothetical protein
VTTTGRPCNNTSWIPGIGYSVLRRSKALEVPSDQLHKELMVAQLPDLIEGRRQEYANERAGLPRYHHLENRI